jgi:hypothetical protein
MLVIHIVDEQPMKLVGDDYDLYVGDSGSLSVKLNGKVIAFFPLGSWKYFTRVKDADMQFTDPNVTTSTTSYKLNVPAEPQISNPLNLKIPPMDT